MAQTRRETKTYNGFTIPLKPDTALGIAMLIAEDEEGNYEPVSPVSTINDARELAAGDLRNRMHRLERGEDPGLCPSSYKLWARGIDGAYRLATEIEA